MTQTAQIHEEQLLTFSGRKSKIFSHVSESPQPESGSILGANELFGKVSPFYYNDRIRLSLRIADDYKGNFILIRGLIEFHRSRNFVFTYDREQRSVIADINADQLDQLKIFLSRILDWVRQEKQFRHALKIARQFESRYRLEQESVYQILKGTVNAHAH